MKEQQGADEALRTTDGHGIAEKGSRAVGYLYGRNADEGMRAVSYLIAGPLLYGGIGWLLDHLLNTGFFLPIGIVLGAAGGVYLIHQRYVRNHDRD